MKVRRARRAIALLRSGHGLFIPVVSLQGRTSVSSNDVCCYVYSSLSESIDLATRGAGMVLATASRPVAQAAPNSLTGSGRRASRPAGCRARGAAPQKPLRADRTVTQDRKSVV